MAWRSVSGGIVAALMAIVDIRNVKAAIAPMWTALRAPHRGCVVKFVGTPDRRDRDALADEAVVAQARLQMHAVNWP